MHPPDFARRTAESVPPLDWPGTWRFVAVAVAVAAAGDAAASRRTLGFPESLNRASFAIAG